MTVAQISEKLGLNLLTKNVDITRTIKGCYIGDLLSWVMSKAEQDNIWLTIMSNVNIVAVASLTDVSCIVMCEDVKPDNGLIEKAEAQGIIVLSTDKDAYTLAVEIGNLI